MVETLTKIIIEHYINTEVYEKHIYFLLIVFSIQNLNLKIVQIV